MRRISRTYRERFLAGAGGLAALICAFFGSELDAHEATPVVQPQSGVVLGNPPGPVAAPPVPTPIPAPAPPAPATAVPPSPNPLRASPPSASPIPGFPRAPAAPVANAWQARTQAAENSWVQVRVAAAVGGVSSFHMVRQSFCRRRGRWEDDANGCANWLRRTGAFGPKPVNSRYWLEVDVIYYLVPVCTGTLTWRAHALVQGSRDQMEVRLECPTP